MVVYLPSIGPIARANKGMKQIGSTLFASDEPLYYAEVQCWRCGVVGNIVLSERYEVDLWFERSAVPNIACSEIHYNATRQKQTLCCIILE